MQSNMPMKQITVRKLDERAIKQARARAAQRGVSLNRVYIDAIKSGLGVSEKPARYDSLDKFAGDSDFGPDWETILSKELNRVDEEEWK